MIACDVYFLQFIYLYSTLVKKKLSEIYISFFVMAYILQTKRVHSAHSYVNGYA